MSDPIDELSDFEPGVPVSPIPAAEIRRRGERLRRRNAALVIGGAAAAIVLVAVPLAVVAGGDDDADPQPAGPALTDDDVLTAEELPARPGLTQWQEIPAEGQVLTCAPDLPAALDSGEDVRHDYGAWTADAPGGEYPNAVVKAAVLQFPSATVARQEYDQAQGWLEGCPGGDNIARKGVSVSTFELEDGLGEWRHHEFYAPDVCDECDAVRFDRMGIAQLGNRIVMVSLTEIGGPLEPEGLDASMDELYEAAVRKAGGLITGGTSTGSESEAPAPDPAVDLAWDLSDMTGDGGEIRGPGPNAPGAAEVSPCDRAAWPATGVDRLAVSTTGPEFAEFRELVEFASADEAHAALAEVRSAVGACATEINELDPTDSQEQAWDVLDAATGYEDSVTFSQTYTDGLPGGTIWQFTRVGKAVLAISTSGEYARGRSATFGAERLTEITTHVTPGMCQYTEAGC